MIMVVFISVKGSGSVVKIMSKAEQAKKLPWNDFVGYNLLIELKLGIKVRYF